MYAYNFSFLNTFNDTLIHLLHWQYWWWFWFTFLLVLYYIFFMRFFFFRSLKFNPKIATSYRSHGKWGDLIICLLPVSWCLNILSNSTTLLKLLEWQSEANFFTLRVRGKQWYWVYKLDFKTLVENLYSTKLTKTIGTSGFLQKNNIYNKVSFYTMFSSLIKAKSIQNNVSTVVDLNTGDKHTSTNKMQYKKFNYLINNEIDLQVQQMPNITYISNINDINDFNNLSKNTSVVSIKAVHTSKFANDLSLNRNRRDVIFTQTPIKLAKYKTNSSLIDNNVLDLKTKSTRGKTIQNNFYTVLKQKPISDWSKFENSAFFDITALGDYSTDYSDSFVLNDNSRIQYYNNMRLLRLNKMLFLPTNLQLSIITNSFDVIHSWFIPGLGLKMDCVPGRSTHHTLYIDIPGIYYGQCAEICGRFHHHVPIRVCALEFEHFMLWFNHFVLSSFVDLDLDKTNTKFTTNINKLF